MFLIRLFLISFLTFSNLFSQSYFYQQYGLDNGLPSDEVYSIFKDSHGYLWVGTNAGVARFNGTEFKTYNTSHGLAGDRVWAITEDSNRNLLFGCYGSGISIFDGLKFKNFNTRTGLVNDYVRAFYYSKKSNLIFIGTDDGISVYNGKTFHNFSNENGKIRNKALFNSFLEKGDTVFCFTYTGRDFYYYLTSFKSFNLLPRTHPFYNHSDRACAALDSPLGTIIGVERTGIKVLKNGTIKVLDGIGQVFGLANDKSNQVWIAGWSYTDMAEAGGLFCYNGTELRSISNELGINSKLGWSVLYDKDQDLLWYGTCDLGLFGIKKSSIKYYKNDFFKIDTLAPTMIFADANNFVWIGSKNKLFRIFKGNLQIIDKKTFESLHQKWLKEEYPRKYAFTSDTLGSFERYERLIKSGKYKFYNPFKYARNKKYYHHYRSEPFWLPSPRSIFMGFQNMGYDKNKNLKILTGYGIYTIDSVGNPVNYFNTVGASEWNRFIYDDQNNLYSTGWGWLTIYHASEKYQDLFQPNFQKEPSPCDVTQMAKRFNEVWFASWHKGLFICVNDSFQNFNSSNSSIPNNLNGICIDKKNKIIAGANNGHIYISDYKNKKLEIQFDFSEKDGILGTTIHWLLVDSKNNLWFGTNKGLNQISLDDLYNSKKPEIRNYNQEEGFNDYSGKIATIDLNDEIWIAAKNQVVRVDTRTLQQFNSKKSTLKLSGIDVNFEPESIPSSLKFPYNKNTLTFYIEKVNYLNPNKDLFRYRIDGVDSKWSKYSKERKFTVNKLAPGKYSIIVESINTSDPSTISQLKIECTITPPFWKTWWFSSFLAIILITVIYFVYQFRINRLKTYNQAQIDVQKRIHDLEMQALQAQMNPHFTFNALCSVQNYILDKDTESALSFLNEFAKLIRLTLNSASQKSIPLSDELEYLKTYIQLEKRRLSGNFSENFEIDPEIDPEETRIPPMLIQPFVENAIKHGLMHRKEGGVLKIFFKYLDDASLHCSVEDNGIGRIRAGEISIKKPEHHSGKGTEITKNRIELFNTEHPNNYRMTILDLFDENSKSIGTKVELVIPLF